MTISARVVLSLCLVIAIAIVPGLLAATVDHYQAAIERFVVPYSHGIMTMTVTVGENEPAGYTLEMWTKGNSASASVIVDASAPFMLGLAFLEEDDLVTAWWPSIEVAKTFSSSQSEEEVGFGMGRLDRILWHSEDYEQDLAKETDAGWEYRVTPRDAALADFSYASIDVDKSGDTLVRAEFYNADDVEIEVDVVSDYQPITTESGSVLLYPMRFAYKDFVNNKVTEMEYTKIDFPTSIDDSVFSLEFLKARSAAALNQEH